MTENLLQFIWQFRYYQAGDLTTSNGEKIQVLFPGRLNKNQGPDFLNARIRIGNTVWAGNVEVHITASEWDLHGHTGDPNYDNVVLHVVWEEDKQIGRNFPTLELKDRIPRSLLGTYEKMMNAQVDIPCSEMIASVNAITVMNWKDRLMAERLEIKNKNIFLQLHQTECNWEEVFRWIVSACFGNKVNADQFEHIARSLPYVLLLKHRHNLFQVEALLFGRAGLLIPVVDDAYQKALRIEYDFLAKKYKLNAPVAAVYFLRMRPANFPTIRLSQLAALFASCDNLFASVRDAVTIEEVKSIFRVSASAYWNNHFVFGEAAASSIEKRVGETMIDNIMINAVIPLLFAYGKHNQLDDICERAINWMMQIPKEVNKITDVFSRLGIENSSALDSQALIQLKTAYCDYRRCLQCAIGNKLLRNSTDNSPVSLNPGASSLQ